MMLSARRLRSMTPANDNAPRTLAGQLTGILHRRNTPDHPPEPIKSNFVTDPAVALVEPEVRATMFTEQNLRVTPSVEEIAREMRHPPVRNQDGQITAIGRLKFSDGTQTEKVSTIGPDGDVIQVDRRMPAGAMLGTSERLTDSSGGGNAPAKVLVSNAALAHAMGVAPRPYIPGRSIRRGRSLKASESRVMLAAAIANTPMLPPVTKCPPGLANGTQQVSDCFIGMKIGSSGKGGLIQWVDLYTAGREHEDWIVAESALSSDDRETLDFTMAAKSLTELGHSGHRRTRERQAVKRLKAANDNYLSALKAFAS